MVKKRERSHAMISYDVVKARNDILNDIDGLNLCHAESALEDALERLHDKVLCRPLKINED